VCVVHYCLSVCRRALEVDQCLFICPCVVSVVRVCDVCCPCVARMFARVFTRVFVRVLERTCVPACCPLSGFCVEWYYLLLILLDVFALRVLPDIVCPLLFARVLPCVVGIVEDVLAVWCATCVGLAVCCPCVAVC
jgi:hypothetical protein